MILGVEGRCIYIPAATVVFIFLTSTILVSNLEKTALTPRTWPSTGRSASTTLEFRYRLRVDFPIKARTPSSQVYKYYEPEVKEKEAPIDINVT